MPTDPENIETVAMPRTPSPATPAPVGQRFAPGTLLASRYRIVSRLGKGGMGEVFRAEDILLGQPVALKFLPESARGNLNFLKRFYDEVRIARQISHPNVCRVHDIGEIDGQPYLSMEYIDGEDLSSLLRRIGRLPADKASEFARKMCAGLAAAHAQGVLHRDLKPGNIMIDGRGEPRITDFGLAAIASGIEGAEIRNGTPAYMAPEQLEGREVSVQSDLYALGLVFYEMFTGKQAHEANSMSDLLRMRQESRLTNPSTLVEGIDPAVERAIKKCLEPDPKLRPASAVALAASLPGGDPLAAAMAAGHTPSPEMVAAAGEEGTLRPLTAIGLVAGIAVAIAAAAWVGTRFQVLDKIPLTTPQVLESKAREIVQGLGYTEPPVDTADAFQFSWDHRSFFWKRDLNREQSIKALATQPSPLTYWYRQSPLPMVAESIYSDGLVHLNDPAPVVAGMVTTVIGTDGRLLWFSAVPPEKAAEKSSGPPDWHALFAAAKLDPAAFTPAEPEWTPLAATQDRAAWTGMYPGQDNMPVRIEAASFEGKPVYFAIVFPWTIPQRTANAKAPTATRAVTRNVYLILLILTALAAAVIARINWKGFRGDVRGATRVALWVAIISMIVWVLRAHHVADAAEQALLFDALPQAAGTAAMFWIVYLALEPWVRRYWPQALISWSRVLAGRWRDPIVGRDILFSLLLGLAYAFYIFLLNGLDGITLGNYDVSLLLGWRPVMVTVASNLVEAITSSLQYFMLLFLLRILLRKQWLASVAFVVLWVAFRTLSGTSSSLWLSALFLAPIYGVLLLIQVRFGLLALMLTLFVFNTTLHMMMTMNFGAWYGESSAAIVVVLAGMALWGCKLALGNRPLLSAAVLEK